MHDEQTQREVALTELCRRLTDALARSRLTKTQLAGQAGLGRTTVHEALQPGARAAPSAETVAALARVLRLPDSELLELRRTAAGDTSRPRTDPGPGRPISQWNPYDLEVHPAGPAPGVRTPGADERILPGYVARDHDRVLADAVCNAAQGHSRMVVLVGTSSTGKTRSCWEAVQPLAGQGWRLWHPFEPTQARAALDGLHRVQPRTVVWLNEAQHYLGDPRSGEEIAATVHGLLTRPERGPVLILGTLWPEYANQYTALPSTSGPDPHSRVRELLARRTITVPDTFNQQALRTAATLAQAGDRLLADTLTRAHTDGRVTQDLAGAPELLRRYEHSTPAAQALLEAAMDARRLGVNLFLPQAFLTDAAIDYVSDQDFDQLTEDWAEAAFADLARPVHGKQALVRRTAPRPQRRPPGSPAPADAPAPGAGPVFRLADYLEEHGRNIRRHLCPPASFWHAAHTHLTHPDDLDNLTRAAEARHRLQWAHHLRHRAADAGSSHALVRVARMREVAGDREGAEGLYRAASDAGDPTAMVQLARMREEAGDLEGAEGLYRAASDVGDPNAFALDALARIRERAGDLEGAERLATQADDTRELGSLAPMRGTAGEREDAERFAQQAADTGDIQALAGIAWIRWKAGDWDGAERFARRAAQAGDPRVLEGLAGLREKAGDQEGAERLAWQAADTHGPDALDHVVYVRGEAGDWEGAERLARQAADAGHTSGLDFLARRRGEAELWEEAERLAHVAADAGDTRTLALLAQMREEAGDREEAQRLYHVAADADATAIAEAAEAGDPHALVMLAEARKATGDWEEAERLARQAADASDTHALVILAEIRKEAGTGRKPNGSTAPPPTPETPTPGSVWRKCGRKPGTEREPKGSTAPPPPTPTSWTTLRGCGKSPETGKAPNDSPALPQTPASPTPC
ncbi:helix-turn-helix domain-containing protein [Streptomyces sp. NBC_00048]|uniref:hypothetical protein n=1 Tax=Streptomyces sp. NBC_00048 TaxID=2975628 RepID=UPI0032530FF7